MSDTIVCGIDHHREWMLHIVDCDNVNGINRDFMWFFNTRAEAETRFAQVAGKMKSQNAIVKIVKVRAYEHLSVGFEQVDKEN